MTIGDIILWILASIGGVGTIIKFFAGLWGKRNVAKYQNQLDIVKAITLRYSDKQFEFYNNLWLSLYNLKLSGDDLWQEANQVKLEKFSKQLRATREDIEKASLFIEDNHYQELINILSHFSEYHIGKQKLINYSKTPDEYDLIQNMINHNGKEKLRYENLIGTIKVDLKQQLKGSL